LRAEGGDGKCSANEEQGERQMSSSHGFTSGSSF
jgi:hypothetical protein